MTALTARSAGLVSCHVCTLVCRRPEAGHARCPRCRARLHQRKTDSLARTWALLVAAVICYLPANLLPVMKTVTLGRAQADTILSGVHYLLTHGQWPLALIVFVASVLVPLGKIVLLVYLLASVQWRWKGALAARTRLYRLVHFVGRWSMVDVYVVTILVALVSLGNLATVEAQPGIIFFGAVVVLTMFAAMTFDPRLMWDAAEGKADE
ncbi:MAG: paraquat-inducible protein A [Gammaproteobacteria bacterium]|jgi:paraquat-inducible protein A